MVSARKRRQQNRNYYKQCSDTARAASIVRKQEYDKLYYLRNHARKIVESHNFYARKSSLVKTRLKQRYIANKDAKKVAVRTYYNKNSKEIKIKNKIKVKSNYHCNKQKIMLRLKAYKKINLTLLRAKRTYQYSLREPNDELKENFLKKIKSAILKCNEILSDLVSLYEQKFADICKNLSTKDLQAAVVRIVAKKLLLLVFNLRRQLAGHFLSTIRCITKYELKDLASFGVRYHVKGGEPFFHEASYQEVEVKEEGKEIEELEPHIGNMDTEVTPEKDIELNNEETEHKTACCAKKWDCSANCRPIPQQEILAIVELYECFKIAPKLLRKQMTYFDSGCPNKDVVTGEEKGHALTCYTASGSTSKMRILRAASTHFPK